MRVRGILLVLSLLGCAGRGRAAPPAPDPDPEPVRPLTTEESSTLFRAEQTLIQRCMAQQGFDWTPSVENPIPEDRDFPYGIDDLTWARTHGYGSDIQDQIVQVRESDPNRRYAAALPPERRHAATDALNGTDRAVNVTMPNGLVVSRSTQGCRAESERDLYGDLATWSAAHLTSSGLGRLAQARVLADPRFTTAVSHWAACMKRAGHDVATPAAARGAFADRAATPASRRREVATATAEATCATSTDLSTTAKDLDRRYADQLRAEHRAQVDTELRLRLQALPKAQALVGSSSR
jgi:hypothetical protein